MSGRGRAEAELCADLSYSGRIPLTDALTDKFINQFLVFGCLFEVISFTTTLFCQQLCQLINIAAAQCYNKVALLRISGDIFNALHKVCVFLFSGLLIDKLMVVYEIDRAFYFFTEHFGIDMVGIFLTAAHYIGEHGDIGNAQRTYEIVHKYLCA